MDDDEPGIMAALAECHQDGEVPRCALLHGLASDEFEPRWNQ